RAKRDGAAKAHPEAAGVRDGQSAGGTPHAFSLGGAESGEILRHPPPEMDMDTLHEIRIGWVEQFAGQVVALASDYPNGHRVPEHRHSRAQLLYPLSGVVTVSTSEGRWMVPPE